MLLTQIQRLPSIADAVIWIQNMLRHLNQQGVVEIIESIIENGKHAGCIYLEMLLHFLPLAIIEIARGRVNLHNCGQYVAVS